MKIKKIFLIFSLFIILMCCVSAISAASDDVINNTVSEVDSGGDVLSISNDEQASGVDQSISASNAQENDVNGQTPDGIKLSSNSNEDILESSDLIVNPDFENGLDGWSCSGNVVTSDDGLNGSTVLLTAASNSPAIMTQSIDWTNIENLTFYYKGDAKLGEWFVVSIGETSLEVHDTTDKGIWKSKIVDTSNITGVENLTFTVSQTMANGRVVYYSYFDSITYTIKENLISNNQNLSSEFGIVGYTNVPILFRDLSIGNPSEWFWDFGDGSNSTNQNPYHTYVEFGTYNVTLKTFNGTDYREYSNKVEIYEQLKANFEIWEGNQNTIFYLDKSFGNPVKWFIDFGDGTNITLDKLVNYGTSPNIYQGYHSFNDKIGNFNVTLTVTNQFGLNDSITKLVSFYNTVAYPINVDSFENSTNGWTLGNGACISTNSYSDEEYDYGDYSVLLSANKYIEKVINFDNIDLIEFDAYSRVVGSGGLRYLYLYIDGKQVYTDSARANRWTQHLSYATNNLVGNHTVKLTTLDSDEMYVDNITLKTNSYYLANFTTAITDISGDDITVQFTDNSYGTYNAFLWTFDGENTSTLQNPTFIFKKGSHDVTLIIYRDDIKMSSITKNLNIDLPSISDTSYATIQDAINAANATSDVIDIPNINYNFNENLVINKSMTLNFNGAVLSAKDASVPLFNITNGATVTVTNLGLNKDSTFVTDKDSKLIIKDSQINYNLALNEGNIELVNDKFNNAYLTLVANTTIANSTITKGGVIVNDGKSRIFNTTLSGCDVAIAQNGGELNIISNLITNNKVGINVTGGKTNLEFNVIINNADYGLVFADNVTNANNWWGSTMPDSYINRTSAGDKYDSYLILNLNTTSSVMGVNKEYVVDVYFTDDSDAIVDGYLKTFALTFTSSDMEILDDNVVIEDGKGQINIKTLKETENTILSTLSEDYELNTPVNSTANVFIEVIGEVIVDNSVVINVEVPLATGNVIFYVDGDVKVVALNNSKANYTISKLTAGNHSIVVFYEGDDVFNSNRNSTTINVPVKEILTSNIKITRVDGNLTVYGILTDSKNNVIANAIINYNINNGITQNTTTGNDGSFKITGENGAIIFVSFEGNESIMGSNDSITLSDIASNQQDNKTISELQTQLNKTQEMVSNLTDKINDANKKISNLTSQLDEAQKVIQNLSGNLISTTISANNLAIKALDNGNIQVTLKDANNKLLTNKSVQVIINGVTYTGTTNNNGVAIISVKYASAGTYHAVVSFLGDDTYKGSIGTSKVVVSKKATTLTAKKATLKVKKAKKIKVTLKSNGKVVAGKTITIKVNKKTFKAKTNKKGVAKIKVKVAKKGKFKAVVKFAGDSTYKAITKKIKLTVKK